TEPGTARLTTTPAGTILATSPGAVELLGMPVHFLLGKPLVVFTDPKDYRRFFHRLHDVTRQVDQVHTWTMQFWPYRRPACDASGTARVSADAGGQQLVIEWTIAPRSATSAEPGPAAQGLRPDAALGAVPPIPDPLEVQHSELDAIRRTYIAALAHELMTPLTVIQGYADTLQGIDARGHPDSVAAAAAAIMDQVTRLRQLATNVLDGARASTGLLTVVQVPVSLPPLVDRALQH